MSSATCPECDRLWKELGEVAQENFRLDERLRCAEDRQDHHLMRAVSARLANLAREQLRVQRSLAAHEAQAHSTPQKAVYASQSGD